MLAPGDLPSLIALSNLYLAQKAPEKAIRRINQEIQGSPARGKLYELLGQLYRIEKDYAKAEASYRKALSIDPNSLGAYSLLGQLFAVQKSMDKAIQEFENVLKLNPRSGATHVLLGSLYATQKNVEKAKHHYREALKIAPNFAVAANNLAWILAESGTDLDEAFRLAQSARDALPENCYVADTLAWVHYKRGAYGSAIEILEGCVQKEGSNAILQLHLALSYAKAGNNVRARVSLEQAAKLDPGLPGLKEAGDLVGRPR